MLFICSLFATENAFSKLKNHRCNLWALVSYFLAIDLQVEMLCSSSLKLFSSYFLQNVKQMFLIWEKNSFIKACKSFENAFSLVNRYLENTLWELRNSSHRFMTYAISKLLKAIFKLSICKGKCFLIALPSFYEALFIESLLF